MNGGGPLEVFIEEDRQQRAAMVLKDVDYLIEGEFEFTSDQDNNEGKHLDTFNRRARKGQCFQRPYLGCREFDGRFALHEGPPPSTCSKLLGERDLGWMLWTWITKTRPHPTPFFHALLKDGVLEVPSPESPEVRR